MRSRIRSKLISCIFPILLFLFFIAGCSNNNQTPEVEKDIHSFANTSDVVVTHLDLDIVVDFDKKQIAGKVGLRIKNKTGTRHLYLDTRDLDIQRVTLGEDETETNFSLGETVEYLGESLIIDISPETEVVNVYYHSNPGAAALQWLEPAQTAGGKKPFLFTQSQAILARTWVPCQDSPGVRITYRAKVKIPSDLMAVMSATNSTQKNPDGIYEFEMPQPIPAYLLALAVGDLEFRSLGERSGVYAEPSVVEKAAYEFADTEKMMAAAEELDGPYRWDRYDIIVLPPSFPFGGMENPRLTFATPTVLAGDRSLVSLIAHELAHSWSGNLVTNANWNDFWLNEGFTTYFENRIMEAVYGKNYAEMLSHLGFQDMSRTIDGMGVDNPDTQLQLNLAERDPDEGMTNIAYEKGGFFLRMLEANIGREKWDAFLREYFDTFAFQSMTSDKFVAYLRENLIKDDQALEEKLQIDQWIYGMGLPENCPKVESGEFAQVEAQIAAWEKGAPAKSLETENWTTQHWLHFLRKLPRPMNQEQMADLDQAFNFTKTGNSEKLNVWLLHAIGNQYEPAYPALENFLIGMGRRKFLSPLYGQLAQTPEGLEMGREIYKKARSSYHLISRNTIDGILKWEEMSG